jgi:hypothetical protein
MKLTSPLVSRPAHLISSMDSISLSRQSRWLAAGRPVEGHRLEPAIVQVQPRVLQLLTRRDHDFRSDQIFC